MSVKLLSARLEVSALRSLCCPDKLVANTVLASLDPSWFGLQSTRKAYLHIAKEVAENGAAPDWTALIEAPSLSKHEKNAIEAVSGAKVAKSVEHAKSLVAALNRYRQTRRLNEVYNALGEALDGDSIEPEALISDVADQISSLRVKAGDIKGQFSTIGLGNNSTNVLKDLLEGSQEAVVPTGFEAFDNVNRGFLDGSLIVIGANSGGGKTAAAASMAVNMTSQFGIDVCMVSLEMTKVQMMARTMAIKAEVPLHKISAGTLNFEEKQKVKAAYAKYVNRLKETGTRFTVWEPEGDLTIEECLLTLQPQKYKVIIVDYISLLAGADGDDQWRQLSSIARYSKVFARTNNCIVVLLCQINDDGKIKFSRSIADHANNAWLWLAPKESEDVSVYDVQQIKCRNQLRFKMRFEADNIIGRIRTVEYKESRKGDEEEDEPSENIKDINDE